MKPERAQELYSDFKEGTLSPAMKLALEQHFESDPAAKQDYEDFARVIDLMAFSDAGEVDVPHGFRASILERVARESATNVPAASGPFAGLIGLFHNPRKLQAAIAIASVAVVGVFSGIALNGAHRPSATQGSNNPIPILTSSPAPLDPSQPIVRGVTVRVDSNGVIYHDFTLRLPKAFKSGTVDAYAVTSTDEIRDPNIREAQAKSIVKQQSITRDVDFIVPVAIEHSAPAGSTLNVVFDVHATTFDGRAFDNEIVVFTPMNPNDSVATTIQPPVNGKYFDSLQTLASDYHVTVIADANTVPSAVQPWSPNDDVEAALAHLAGSANAEKTLSPDTYFIYRKLP